MRISSMARQRIITLLVLTSLVVMMVTISRYSTITQPTSVRLMISQQKLNEYQQKLRLIVSEQNSNKTLNNLLENLMKTKSHIKDINTDDKIRPVVPKLPVSSSSSSPPVDNQPQGLPLIQSEDDHDSLVPINNNNQKRDSNPDNGGADPKPIPIDYDLKVQNSVSKRPVTEGPSKISPKIKSENKNSEQNSNQSNNILAKSIVESNPKSDVESDNLVIDQKSVQSNQKLQQLDVLENNDNELNKIKFKPKLVFDSEDLKTTESMRIDKPLSCDDDLGAALDLFVIVNSAVNHWQERRAVRDTWGRFAVERGSPLLFLIGSSTDPLVQQRVEEEDARYGDLLQGHFIDNYFNLTLKTISMMKWLSDRCSKVKYVLKVDDDMFVNMQNMIDFAETRNFDKCVIGKLAKKWKPHRNTNNKWYVPINAFNATIFPSFATGPAYMMSGDAVQPLYEWSIKLKPIYLEDVYMTGIVAERAHIRRLNHAMMTNVHIKGINACNFPKFMTSHKHSPQEIRKLWDEVYSQPTKPCPSPTPKPKPKPARKSVTPSPKPKPVLNSG